MPRRVLERMSLARAPCRMLALRSFRDRVPFRRGRRRADLRLCRRLRAVTWTDGVTADFYQSNMKILDETATRIINEAKGVNRVVYDVRSKPLGTIEWE